MGEKEWGRGRTKGEERKGKGRREEEENGEEKERKRRKKKSGPGSERKSHRRQEAKMGVRGAAERRRGTVACTLGREVA